jgi:Tol biopolymer transport system component
MVGGSIGLSGFSVSPTTNKVVYWAHEDDPTIRELYSTNFDSASVVKISGALTSPGISSASWSPDGTRVAYISQAAGAQKKLYVTTPAGGSAAEASRISGGLPYTVQNDYSWAPDSSRIAYRAYQDSPSTFELYTSANDGSDNQKVSGPQVSGVQGVQDFKWSTDSKRIAYRADDVTLNFMELFTTAPANSSALAKVSASGLYIGLGSFYYWTKQGDITYSVDPNLPSIAQVFRWVSTTAKNVLLSGDPSVGGTTGQIWYRP